MTEALQREQTQIVKASGWGAALAWGFGAALIHRVFLTVWMAAIWALVSSSGGIPANQMDFHNTADLPALSPLESQLFGFWRRWDAVHYLDLATHGYRLDNPGATVFSPLAPLMFRAVDIVMPSGIDLAAAVVQTIAFGAVLTLLHRFVTTYYNDPELARWSVGICALLPLSFYFAAPMSESIYLALVVATLYAASRGNIWIAAVVGFLAALARSQGALLAGVAALFIFEKAWDRRWNRASLIAAVRETIRRGWMLALIPLGAVVFELYRNSTGLPPAGQVYAEQSYVFFVNPIQGLIYCLQFLINSFPHSLTVIDVWAFLISFILIVIAVRSPRHRRVPLLAYSVGYWLVFLTKMNWIYGTDDPFFVQSFGRYTLVLFPLTVVIADGFRSGGFWVRIIGVAALLLMLLGLAALFPFAQVGP